jgi:hypothetical protein
MTEKGCKPIFSHLLSHGWHRRPSLWKVYCRWSGGKTGRAGSPVSRSERDMYRASIGFSISEFGLRTSEFFFLSICILQAQSPALSAEKSAPHDSKRHGLASRPWERQAFTPNFASSERILKFFLNLHSAFCNLHLRWVISHC